MLPCRYVISVVKPAAPADNLNCNCKIIQRPEFWPTYKTSIWDFSYEETIKKINAKTLRLEQSIHKESLLGNEAAHFSRHQEHRQRRSRYSHTICNRCGKKGHKARYCKQRLQEGAESSDAGLGTDNDSGTDAEEEKLMLKLQKLKKKKEKKKKEAQAKLSFAEGEAQEQARGAEAEAAFQAVKIWDPIENDYVSVPAEPWDQGFSI